MMMTTTDVEIVFVDGPLRGEHRTVPKGTTRARIPLRVAAVDPFDFEPPSLSPRAPNGEYDLRGRHRLPGGEFEEPLEFFYTPPEGADGLPVHVYQCPRCHTRYSDKPFRDDELCWHCWHCCRFGASGLRGFSERIYPPREKPDSPRRKLHRLGYDTSWSDDPSPQGGGRRRVRFLATTGRAPGAGRWTRTPGGYVSPAELCAASQREVESARKSIHDGLPRLRLEMEQEVANFLRFRSLTQPPVLPREDS